MTHLCVCGSRFSLRRELNAHIAEEYAKWPKPRKGFPHRVALATVLEQRKLLDRPHQGGKQ